MFRPVLFPESGSSLRWWQNTETKPKAPGLVGQDVEQSAGYSREVASLGSERLKPRFEQAERVVERVVHDPHAGGAERQRSEALCLRLEIEQGVAIEG
jgi:hypothetical protein